MSCYFIANIQINDESEYKKYIENAGKVFSRYKGKYLAVDNSPDVLEGEWKYSRVVIIEFPNKEELLKWYNSPEYQEIVQYRLNAARCDTILVNGLET